MRKRLACLLFGHKLDPMFSLNLVSEGIGWLSLGMSPEAIKRATYRFQCIPCDRCDVLVKVLGE